MCFKDLTKIIDIISTNDGTVCKDVWGRRKECRSSVGRILVLTEQRELEKLTKTCAIPG